MNAVNARVQRLIDKVALNRSEFSDKTGISTVVISHICSGRNKVSLAAIQQILKAYPEISADYLISGSGGMFREDNQRSQQLNQSLKDLRESIRSFTKDLDQNITKIIQNIENS